MKKLIPYFICACIVSMLFTSVGCKQKQCAAYGGAIDKVKKPGRFHKPQSGLWDKKMKGR